LFLSLFPFIFLYVSLFNLPRVDVVFSAVFAGVFYCGPVALANELESLSRTFTQKSTTKFSFHKENF